MSWEAGGSSPPSRVCASSVGNDRGGVEPSSRTDRLYAITRADLSVGMRAAQAGHALIEWVLQYGEPCENLVVLQVPGRLALEELARRLDGRRVRFFREPDMGNQLTAIAAGPECWREVSSIGLMR